MGKRGKVYIIIALVTVAILMLIQYTKPKEVNWFPSFVAQHKIPYGTYVLNDLMTARYGDMLQQVNKPPYEFLKTGDNHKGTYFFANSGVSFGEIELNSLLDWTSKGNTLFIASVPLMKT